MARKKAQAFRTITEVSDWLDTPSHVLRFWESKFPQIKPVKRAGGRRYYRPEDLKLIGGIKVLLHDKGTTIAAVNEMIKSDGEASVEVHSPEPIFPEKGRRKLRKAAAQAKADAKEDVVVTTQPEEDITLVQNSDAADKPDLLKLSEPSIEDTTPTNPDAKRDSITMQPPMHLTRPTPSDVADTVDAQSSPQTPLETQNTVSENETQRENMARDVISNAISRRHSETDENDIALKLGALTTRAQIANDQILNIEDLYFQLQRIRNRMKRRLDAI